MSVDTAAAPEVFSARELARAARVSPAEIQRLIRAGVIPTVDGRFVRMRHALEALRRLRGLPAGALPRAEPFRAIEGRRHAPGRAFGLSGAAHLGILLLLGSVATGPGAVPAERAVRPEPSRLVFLAEPGPGGGGGGGGDRRPESPPAARTQGRSALRSPVPPPRSMVEAHRVERPATPPSRPRPVERPSEPPPPPAVTAPLPQVIAPVASAAADPIDRAGTLADAAPVDAASRGPGSGTGAGSGAGSGIGEGSGPGIGAGTGGGTGGGPYRPGSGIEPPSLLREVKPDYTPDARRRGIEGEVLVEIVVRADGTVGPVRLVQRLGAGLDERAVEAVRQWRFAPARRHGTPVDVLVEVAVEFRLR